MSKTLTTINLENAIYKKTSKRGVFGCFEVTIGYFGNERVDYITYDTKGTWRCYEVKSSKSDFYSLAKKTFVGHYNYFVMTGELYDEVKKDIEPHIGVYVYGELVKRAKKRELLVKEEVLKNSLIRSLNRENQKFIKVKEDKSKNNIKNKLNRFLNKKEKEETIKYKQAILEVCKENNLNLNEICKKFNINI